MHYTRVRTTQQILWFILNYISLDAQQKPTDSPDWLSVYVSSPLAQCAVAVALEEFVRLHVRPCARQIGRRHRVFNCHALLITALDTRKINGVH